MLRFTSTPAAYATAAVDTLSLSITLAILYHTLSKNLKTVRQRSWILTLIASAVLTLGSLPVLWKYAREGFALKVVMDDEAQKIGHGVLVFFRAYLITDLLVGSIYYPDQISCLTGWFHHSMYIVMLTYLRRTQWSGIFLLVSILELPTLHLSLSNLYPSLFRHDALFLGLFFATRILFHGFIIVSFALNSNRQLVGGSWLPSMLLGTAMPLHLAWFYNGVTGYTRRQSKLITSAHKVDVVPTVVDHKEPTSTPEANVTSRMEDMPDLEYELASDDETDVETPDMSATHISPLITPFMLDETATEFDFVTVAGRTVKAN